jgi:hypothetical protein
MSDQKAPQAQPKTNAVQVDPVVVLDVAAQAHAKTVEAQPTTPASSTVGEQERLEDVLPAINEIAKKVGGFRKLAEIANNLDQNRT